MLEDSYKRHHAAAPFRRRCMLVILIINTIRTHLHHVGCAPFRAVPTRTGKCYDAFAFFMLRAHRFSLSATGEALQKLATATLPP
eukprot:5745553-Amphidinium_carterae.2